MIEFQTGVAIVGMAAGLAAATLGVAQLTCEHGDSPWTPRAATVLLVMLSAYTALDCWDVWAGVDDTLDYEAIAFCLALTLSWGYRRAFGFQSSPKRKTS